MQAHQNTIEVEIVSKVRSGGRVTAFELISDYCMHLVERHLPGRRRPLAASSTLTLSSIQLTT